MEELLNQNQENLKQQEEIPKQETQENQEIQEKQKTEKTQEKKISASFWAMMFFLAGIKDLLEFIFGLIPVIGSLLVWIISFLLGGLIIITFFISGNYKKFKQAQIFLTIIGQLGDLVPVLNVLPLSTATIAFMYLASKNKTLSLILEKTSKIKSSIQH